MLGLFLAISAQCNAEIVGRRPEQELVESITIPQTYWMALVAAMFTGMFLIYLMARRVKETHSLRMILYSSASLLIFCSVFVALASFLARVGSFYHPGITIWGALYSVWAKIPFLLAFRPWGAFVLCGLWTLGHPATLSFIRRNPAPLLDERAILIHGFMPVVLFMWLLVAFCNRILFKI